MTALLAVLQVLPVVIPVLHQLCLVVEQQFPGAKRGAEKLDAVLTMFSTIAPTLGPVLGPLASVIPSSTLKAVVGAVVGGMNAGAKQSTTAAPAPIAAPPGT